MCLVGGLVAQLCPTLATPWTVARQAPLSMGVSRQEYWSGLPFPSPGDLPDPGIEPGSPALQVELYPLSSLVGGVIPWVLDHCGDKAGNHLSGPAGSRWRRGCSLPGLRSTWAPCTAPSGPPGRLQARPRHHSLQSPWQSILARQPSFLQSSPLSINPPQVTLSLCPWRGPQLMFIQQILPLLWASLVAQLVKNPPPLWETWVRSLGWEDPPGEGLGTHSSILAWRIPQTA